uniref:Uncharacterized protein n=1 Tax=Nelumbo nucifera TaxID=4432 RepID=A0A822ZJ84_NELNU|nr:TPA_asm: hypothetical protein HUJ06_001306 [Nelumbo nucifera]
MISLFFTVAGVESASLQGEDKSQIVVEGEGIDSITLAVSLRKSLGSAELVSVSEVKEKKEEKTNTSQSTTAATVQPVDWFLSYNQAAYNMPQYCVYQSPNPNTSADACAIM